MYSPEVQSMAATDLKKGMYVEETYARPVTIFGLLRKKARAFCGVGAV